MNSHEEIFKNGCERTMEPQQLCDFMDKEFSNERDRNGVAVSYLRSLQRETKPVLYSTNPFITSAICRSYRKGKYRVWCSEVFDPSWENKTSIHSLIGPTSSPKKIADDLRAEMRDAHSSRKASYRATFERLGREWLASGSINQEQFQEILGLLSLQSETIWQPFIYIIPRWLAHNSSRLELVAPNRRAGPGPEYIINDLEHDEFDMMGWI